MKKGLFTFLVVVVMSIFIIGCGAFTLSLQQRQAITAGKTGCPVEKIKISNLQHPGGGMSTWIAECDGKKFSCSRENNISSCSPLK